MGWAKGTTEADAQASNIGMRGAAVLAAAALLLLSGPGVKLVRADDALTSSEPAAAACEAPPAAPDAAAEPRHPAPGRHEVIPLNNQGYNYGPYQERDLKAVKRALQELQTDTPPKQ